MSGGTRVEARRVVVRGLVLPARIGVYAHEKGNSQTVRIDVVLDVDVDGDGDGGGDGGLAPISDELGAVVSYDDVIAGIRELLSDGHIHLAETLAERIADQCLGDPRVARASVLVEKPEAVAEADGVGAEVVKVRGEGPES